MNGDVTPTIRECCANGNSRPVAACPLYVLTRRKKVFWEQGLQSAQRRPDEISIRVG